MAGITATSTVTWRGLRRVMERLEYVLGRLVASWKCFEVSEDWKYQVLKKSVRPREDGRDGEVVPQRPGGIQVP